MSDPVFLGIDAGGSKTAWGVFNEEGRLLKSDRFPTPQEREKFLAFLEKLAKEHQPAAIGIGIAGTISADHEDVIVCPNIPDLGHLELAEILRERTEALVAIDNDARCALIGEVWQGIASQYSSAVLITLGTGVGGAVMQREVIVPHPEDISLELGHLMVDPTDLFPAPSGKGTLEALIGGHNLEDRLDIDLAKIAKAVRENDPKAVDIWKQISYFFIQGMRAVHAAYRCQAIIIGGVGSKDLEYYLQEEPPCPVVAATLGELAGLYGAGRLAIDRYLEKTAEETDDWE